MTPVNEALLPIDTGVLIALAAANAWELFDCLEQAAVVTPAVLSELRSGPAGAPGVQEQLPSCIRRWPDEVAVPVWLRSVLDAGEASVIALALEQGWPEVAIDEAVGRSVARTCKVRLTGSLGLLIRAKRRGYPLTLAAAIGRIREHGIWLGHDVAAAALRAAGEA